jgi:sulfofructose kinase
VEGKLKSPRSIDVLGLGISPVDFFVAVEKYPRAGTKVDGIPESRAIAGGGPVPNALCALSRLGGRASFIGAFGADNWGALALRQLDEFGVDRSLCIVKENSGTALAFAWVEQARSLRTIVLDKSPKLALKPSDIILNRLPHPKIIHIDGRDIPACVKLARWGRRAGAKVMLDIGSVRNKVDDLFPFTDYLICADRYALHYHATASVSKAVQGFHTIGIPEVVVTSGENGSVGIDREGCLVQQRAFRVETLDVTGAGDAFHGGYLYGLLHSWNLAGRLKFASAVAALSCTRMGARAGLPTLPQVNRFLARHKDPYD